jgi:hypothetical protein
MKFHEVVIQSLVLHINFDILKLVINEFNIINHFLKFISIERPFKKINVLLSFQHSEIKFLESIASYTVLLKIFESFFDVFESDLNDLLQFYTGIYLWH